VETRGATEGYAPVFWMAFTRSANPMLLADFDRHIVAANEPAATLFGRPASEMAGMTLTALLDHPDEALPDDEWRGRVMRGEWSGRRRVRCADGSLHDIDFAMRATRIDGRVLALGVCLHEAPVVEHSRNREPVPLTAREREVLTLIALGHVSKDICEQLHIAPDTVRAHVRNAMAKTGARTRAQLIAIALADGLIHVEG
jgi:PAS domain S-box-containing protein